MHMAASSEITPAAEKLKHDESGQCVAVTLNQNNGLIVRGSRFSAVLGTACEVAT
jgi:hypothetical protein